MLLSSRRRPGPKLLKDDFKPFIKNFSDKKALEGIVGCGVKKKIFDEGLTGFFSSYFTESKSFQLVGLLDDSGEKNNVIYVACWERFKAQVYESLVAAVVEKSKAEGVFFADKNEAAAQKVRFIFEQYIEFPRHVIGIYSENGVFTSSVLFRYMQNHNDAQKQLPVTLEEVNIVLSFATLAKTDPASLVTSSAPVVVPPGAASSSVLSSAVPAEIAVPVQASEESSSSPRPNQ